MTVTPSVSTPVTPGIQGVTTGADASDISVESSGLFALLMAALVPQPAPAAATPVEAPGQPPTDGQASGGASVPTIPPGLVTRSTDASPPATGLPTAHVPLRKTTAAPANPDSGVAPDPAIDTASGTTPRTTATPLPAVGATPEPAVGEPRHASASAANQGVSSVAPTGVALPEPTPPGHSPRANAEAPVPAEAAAAPAAGPANAVAPTGVPTASSAGQPASAATPAPLPVSRQVIPELTRMSTLGEGVHRLTMTLRPEALGEVRVTMTVRDGSIHVRLAAGTEAQHALVPDLTELQQVLKLGSGSDVRVVLRDLTGIPATPDQQSSSQTGSQTNTSAGGQQGAGHHASHGAPTGDPGTSAGSGDQSRREAGTPRDINATDGVVDGTSGSRSQAVRRARPTGVDLTM